MAGLLSVQEAQQRILSVFHATQTESVALANSAGRVLAEDVSAPGDLPPFTNSSMDGFAVRASDTADATPEKPVSLRVIADIQAGGPAEPLPKPGLAARIMTGAPLPPGADAVVPVEDTNWQPGVTGALDINASEQSTVLVYGGIQAGEHIRPKGQDVRRGQLLLQKGRQLLPQDLGMLASVGKAAVTCYRRPRVALFSSGNELVLPGQSLAPGQIYDSNQFVLAALLEQAGADVLRLPTAPDDPLEIKNILNQAVAAGVDLIVTSAGVSVGAYDYVREIIEAHGNLKFWRVNMRPGKPLAFGEFSNIPLIGLPGNPVSAYVGCRVFVFPAIFKLAGLSKLQPRRERATLSEPVESDGRESYLRAIVSPQSTQEGAGLTARLTGHQGSGNMYSLVQANALLIVPSGVKSLPSGSEVDIWFLDDI